jgi:hypothetical protein
VVVSFHRFYIVFFLIELDFDRFFIIWLKKLFFEKNDVIEL